MGLNDSVPSGLIRDMGRHSGSSLHDVTPEQQLMQRAGDPLLVREFLSRQSTPEGAPGMEPPMSVEATIGLARYILAQGSLELVNFPPLPKRYAAREPLLENSRVPSTFTPSVQDREGAFEIGQSQSGKGAPAAALTGAAAVIGALALSFVLLWIWLQLVWS
jgi:hypothetical protein